MRPVSFSESEGSQKVWLVVIQCKSDRVLFFTDNLEHVGKQEDWFYTDFFIGHLPAEISLKNCWRWRFREQKFVDTKAENVLRSDRFKARPENIHGGFKSALDKRLRALVALSVPRPLTQDVDKASSEIEMLVMLDQSILGNETSLTEPSVGPRRTWFLDQVKEAEWARARLFAMRRTTAKAIPYPAFDDVLYNCEIPNTFEPNKTLPVYLGDKISDTHRIYEQNRLRLLLVRWINCHRAGIPAHADATLQETELIKDNLLAKIDRLETHDDLTYCQSKIEELNKSQLLA